MTPFLIIALAALNIADAATTLKALSYPRAREVNPIMRFILRVGGPKGFAAFKLIAGGAICWVLWSIRETDAGLYASLASVALYVFVVVNNLKVIRELRGRKP